MESGTVASAPNYISDWQAGADGQRYTADDQPVRNGAKLPAILDTLVNDSAKKEDDWRRVQDSTLLPVSMIHLHSSPLLATMISFVHQEETIHLNVDPVLRQLVYGKDQVAIKEEVWMPLMGGLY